MHTAHTIAIALLCYLSGAASCFALWTHINRVWARDHGHNDEADMHTQLFIRALVVVLMMLLASVSIGVLAQAPDGRMYHALPPPMNITNGGLLLDKAAQQQQKALISVLGGTALGAVFYGQNRNVGSAIAGAGLCVGVCLQFDGLHLQRRSAMLFQLGYHVETRYDLVPDSVDDLHRSRIISR